MNKIKKSNHGRSQGPDMNTLHHRLTDYPKEWMDSQLPSYFYTIVHDSIYELSGSIKASDLSCFKKPNAQCDWYSMTLLIAYFLMDDQFNPFRFDSDLLIKTYVQIGKELSLAGVCKVYVSDVDRREEFIRVVLHAIKLRPHGESEETAEARLQAVSSQERMKVLQAAKVAEQRAQKLRTALAKQKAKEAADKMTRE